jgi:flagellar hook-associated protein FlgK
MANLLNLQNAYGANARIMTAVREMFQELMQVL